MLFEEHSIEFDFGKWLLLSEIGHVAMERQVYLPLPDETGRPHKVPVSMCDPMFETYHPVGYRLDSNNEIEEYTWLQMVNMNPMQGLNGEKPGIGWEGLIPFTDNLFFSCAAREKYAVISKSRNLIRVPDNWFMHALFIDDDGEISYYVPRGIFQSGQSKAVI